MAPFYVDMEVKQIVSLIGTVVDVITIIGIPLGIIIVIYAVIVMPQ